MLCMIFCIGGGSLALAEEVTLTTADYTWSAVNNQVEHTIGDVTFNFKGGYLNLFFIPTFLLFGYELNKLL